MAGDLRIVIAADFHLGASVAAPRDSVEQAAAGARGRALEGLIALCREVSPHLVLLPGDLFDAPQPNLAARLALEKTLAAIAGQGSRVFIAPGNHDPFISSGYWETWQPPTGVTVFPPRGSGLALAEAGVWLAGAAHDSATVTRDLSQTLPPPPEGMSGIACLHANLEKSGGDEGLYAPTSLKALSGLPFELWALGHLHAPNLVSSRPLVLYPGAVQGGHFGETGAHGAWVATRSSRGWEAAFHPLAPLVFEDLLLDSPKALASLAGLVREIRGAMDPRTQGGAVRCLRLGLQGPSPLAREDPAELERALAAELGLAGLLLDAGGLRPELDLAALSGEPHVLGVFLRLLTELEQNPQRAAEFFSGLKDRLHPLGREAGPELVAKLAPRLRSLALAALVKHRAGEEAR